MRLLDLYCGAGGAGMGYHRAGFEIVGIDAYPQPNYPFTFIQRDAVAFLEEATVDFDLIRGFDGIHASPPCQAYTNMNNRWGSDSPALIEITRHYLHLTGLPYIIENVIGARDDMLDPILLTGEMFGLKVHRPRLFELNWPMLVPVPPSRQKDPVAVYGKMDGRRLWTRNDGSELRAPKNLQDASDAMGIDWMTWDELREAIPPDYTELIGRELLAQLLVR